jgi:hypothetical protein
LIIENVIHKLIINEEEFENIQHESISKIASISTSKKYSKIFKQIKRNIIYLRINIFILKYSSNILKNGLKVIH